MKLIILDRDGVINQDRDDFVKSADEWIPIAGSMDAIAFLTEAGYTVAVATNQSGIGRKYFTMQELTEMHNKMHRLAQQAGGVIDGIWFCPHTAADGCDCRKPAPGMVNDILSRFNAEAADTCKFLIICWLFRNICCKTMQRPSEKRLNAPQKSPARFFKRKRLCC